jgi:hypothetical protein
VFDVITLRDQLPKNVYKGIQPLILAGKIRKQATTKNVLYVLTVLRSNVYIKVDAYFCIGPNYHKISRIF